MSGDFFSSLKKFHFLKLFQGNSCMCVHACMCTHTHTHTQKISGKSTKQKWTWALRCPGPSHLPGSRLGERLGDSSRAEGRLPSCPSQAPLADALGCLGPTILPKADTESLPPSGFQPECMATGLPAARRSPPPENRQGAGQCVYTLHQSSDTEDT